MSELSNSSLETLTRIRSILAQARNQALNALNLEMVRAYWEVGREIVEEEQRGAARAGYGQQLAQTLALQLTAEFGKGFTATNLSYMRQVYRAFPNLHALRGELSWTHYRLLSKIKQSEVRAFYLEECVRARWTTRNLERQIASLLFERLALSRDQAGVRQLAEQGAEPFQPSDLVRDPYVLEFTGLPERNRYLESDLEQALMDRLQSFLLELGRDLFFVARQQRITLEGDTFFIDLVFYHRTLRCFMLIDLKVGKLTHQDLGQMQLYTGYYALEETREGENPPIGLILCTDKNDATVRYTLHGSNQQVFASTYLLHLPSEEDLRRELVLERNALLEETENTDIDELPDEMDEARGS
jgi:predicted nuclease of restriction endonuclease-like (RecB) superfamily